MNRRRGTAPRRLFYLSGFIVAGWAFLSFLRLAYSDGLRWEIAALLVFAWLAVACVVGAARR